MSLKDQIKEDVKTAMREKDAFKRDTLRGITAAIKQVEVDNRIELDDGGVIEVLQKMIKQRNDAIEQYREGGREELAEKEANEIAILQTYLPAQLSDEELKEAVAAIIAETGASSGKDMGKVMGAAKGKIGAAADNKRISAMAKELLG